MGAKESGGEKGSAMWILGLREKEKVSAGGRGDNRWGQGCAVRGEGQEVFVARLRGGRDRG